MLGGTFCRRNISDARTARFTAADEKLGAPTSHGEKAMTLKCEIYTQTSQTTVTVRIRTSVSNLRKALQQAYGAIIQYLAENEEQPAGPPFAVYDRRGRDSLDVEAGFPVFKSLPGKEGIQAGQLPAGKVASCLFTGPYDHMEPAYRSLNGGL